VARIAFGLPLALEDGLASEAARHGHETVARAGSAAELAVQVTALKPAIAVVSAEPRYLSARLLAACDDAGVRLIALVGEESGRRNAAALGVYETADAPASWVEIESVLDVAPTPPRSTGQAPGRGEVIAVWGPAGSPGRTTVAIGIAAELASLGHTVALADVDTHGASIAPALGMLDEAPGFAAACRLAGSGSLTRGELERIGQRYESPLGGFWVLTGIGRPSRWPELSADRVAATVRACRDWVDFTILDTSASLENDEEIASDLFAPRRNAATVTAVHEADRVVAVGSADPVGMSRFLRAHVDVIEAAATHDVTVVMNRVRASAIGLNPNGQVTRTLSRFGGIESPVLVPHDLAALDGAVLSGRTLADSAPRSAARLAIRELVTSRLAASTASGKRGLFGRAPRDG
jgi:MinD-like ATPase involved in chromosome partitioning or flagellar assembly